MRLEVPHRALPGAALLAIGAVDVEEEDALREAEVHVVGAVGTEAGRALVALGQDPFRDAGLAEVAAAAGDAVGVVGDELERVREGAREGRRDRGIEERRQRKEGDRGER